ncbi:MAG: S9 family peptidase [Bacteroidales bacterium]|nr:S9 family peptidase [Bacteroidales bacterium]
MKRLISMSILLILLAFSSLTQYAQTSGAALTLEDIYKNETYPTRSYRSVRWLDDSRYYTTLERNREKACSEIVRYHAGTGERVVLVGAGQLIPEQGVDPLDIRDYHWSADNNRLLLFTNTRRVWRYHTRGDYWVLDLISGKLQQLGASLKPASLMFAKFSPDGTRVAYVSEHNIFVEELGDGAINPLTSDGGERFVNGTFDWLYEEEFSCRDGFRWSNDGEKIIFWHSDTDGTGTFYLINNLDSLYSVPLPFPYPKVGTANSAVKIGVVSSSGGVIKWFDVPGDPRNHYLVRMEVVPGKDQVILQQLNRLQNTNRVWIGDLETMEIENILTETDEAFLDVHDDLVWLEGNRYFTWTSERDGWRHLYRISLDGKEIRQVTSGAFDVISLECVHPRSGFVYYIASPDNPTQRYLYRSRLNGKGDPEKISPAEQQGQHHYLISGDASLALHTYESAQTPPVISLVELGSHRTVRVLEDNREVREKYAGLNLTPKEFFRIDIGEVLLDAWMIKPADFDPAGKYPLIFHVYGEPAGSTVQDSWGGGDLWHQYLAQLGYVVISVDNRGTAAPRGKAWRNSIYEQIGILAARDQAAAAKKILAAYSFLDSERVGIWGWSGGGSMTLNGMFRYPDIYKTGIAIAFVSHQKLYDTAYQERYMGLPGKNAEGYLLGSPITHAAKLEGKLLLIHGTADDNVHYQSFELLVDELVKQDKLFDMFSYPMRTHAIRERENTSLHLRRTMARYWLENL